MEFLQNVSNNISTYFTKQKCIYFFSFFFYCKAFKLHNRRIDSWLVEHFGANNSKWFQHILLDHIHAYMIYFRSSVCFIQKRSTLTKINEYAGLRHIVHFVIDSERNQVNKTFPRRTCCMIHSLSRRLGYGK